MMRAHRIRLNPTPDQAAYFERNADVARFTWNWALGEYNNALAAGEKPKLLALKKEFNRRRAKEGFAPWVDEVQSYANQYAFTDLQAALSRYFKLRKEGKLKPPEGWKPRKDGRPFGWPKFKARSMTQPAFGVANTAFSFLGQNVRISRCPGLVNMAEPLRFPNGRVLGARVTKVANHWYMSVQFELPDPEPQPVGGVVGVELGVRYRAVTSDGDVFENPKALDNALRKMKRLQRKASRQWEMNGKKPTQNWRKTQMQIARLHERIANIRRENAHVLTTSIARKRFAVVGVRHFDIKGMMGDANRNLARRIADAGMYQVRAQLAYKVPTAGGEVVNVGDFYPSTKTCSECGKVGEPIPLSVRHWECVHCGAIHERDRNAALNIRDEAVKIVSAA